MLPHRQRGSNRGGRPAKHRFASVAPLSTPFDHSPGELATLTVMTTVPLRDDGVFTNPR